MANSTRLHEIFNRLEAYAEHQASQINTLTKTLETMRALMDQRAHEEMRNIAELRETLEKMNETFTNLNNEKEERLQRLESKLTFSRGVVAGGKLFWATVGLLSGILGNAVGWLKKHLLDE